MREIMKERPERDEARKLYNDGMTYPQISETLNVSKSTVSKWCSDLAEQRREDRAVKAAKKKLVEKKTRAAQRIYVRRSAQPPYENYWLYHYKSKDNCARYQLVPKQRGINRNSGHLVISKARYNMAVHVGRILDRDEYVYHKPDGDPSNDEVDNLILSRGRKDYEDYIQQHHPKLCVICEEVIPYKSRRAETCSRPCKNILVSGIMLDKSNEKQI